MRGSTGAVNTAKVRIISAAANLFHKKGVRSTRINEISKAAGVSMRQLQRHFRTKSDIAEEVVLAYLAEIKAGTSRLHHRIESWSDLGLIFNAHIELLTQFQMRRGCPLGVIGNELAEEDERIRRDLSLVFEALEARVAGFLKKEKSEARLLPTAKEERIAHLYVAAMQGAMLLGKVRRDSYTVKRIFADLSMHLNRYRIR